MTNIPSGRRAILMMLAPMTLVGCSDQPPVIVGILTSDRIELVADVAEPIIEIRVKEGDHVSTGQMLVRQDTRRIDARLSEAQAALQHLQAVLAEQQRGPRAERIAAARAVVTADELEWEFREREWQRQQVMNLRELGERAMLEQTRAQLDIAAARLAASRAQLAELVAGVTVEELDQTQARIRQLEAQIAGLQIEKDRHQIVATSDAQVDSLPFEAGEQPRKADIVAVLLLGTQPHARVYVPEALRVQLNAGDRVTVHVDGLPQILNGVVRRIANEPAFTPYYSLTERDRGRLSYIAEIVIEDFARRLPDGVPVEVHLSPGRQP